MLAMQRGEVDALSMEWSILRITGEPLIRERKRVNLLLQTGIEKEPDLLQIPRMIDLARNDDERTLLELFSSPSLIGRSVVAPPGTPPERVSELRRAFMATIQRPELPVRSEAHRVGNQSLARRRTPGGRRENRRLSGPAHRACAALLPT